MRRALLVIVLIGFVGAAAAAWVIYRRTSEPFKGYDTAEQFVTIEPGSGTRRIGRSLIEAGVVRDEATFRAALWRTGLARSLQAGEYRFDRPMTPAEVIDKIGRGEVYNRRITFREGLTIREMAQVFESQQFGRAADFTKAAANAALITELDPAARDLEGYLFPETYSLPRTATADTLVQLMVDRFKELFTADLKEAAAARQLTIRQAVTLASIVEKETGLAEERPLVAAVYSNRLKIGMGLQCDPTVIYALEKAGRYDGNLRREDLSFDSPYNTYKYAGLPPGPIASPGLASLKASLSPADVPYLYFVSRNDGSHVFAETLDEHNANVRKFQVEYFRARRAADRAAEGVR